MTETATIFDIQRFSLHDGPGVRTTIFFKGCPLRCLWCQNPESLGSNPELAYYDELCGHCGACTKVCKAHNLGKEKHHIEYELCKSCGECTLVCPNRAVRIIGQSWTKEALCQEVLRDKDFFEESKGGLTLSGGEPGLQAVYLEGILPKIKAHGIHITLETSGAVFWPRLEKILTHIDLVYFDLKIMDTNKHRQYTGADNELILANFTKIAWMSDQGQLRLEARMPIIPAVNDGDENIRQTSTFLKDNGHDLIYLLPYHKMGEGKLRRIKASLASQSFTAASMDDMRRVGERFQTQGIKTKISSLETK